MSSYGSYIPVPVATDPVDVAGEAFDYLTGKVPGWLPSNGDLDAWLIEALAQVASELRVLVSLVPVSIFEYFGETVLGLPPYSAVQATASTTWTTVDAGGYTIEAGTVIALTPPSSQTSYAFTVTSDAVIPAGQTVAAGVECRALEAGAAASGLTGTIAVIDPLSFVASVTLDYPTSGGADEETTDAYLARLSSLLTLLSPRPILPQDFAQLAQQSVAGVARAVAVDLYNPGPPINANCPRCVTVVVVDAAGEPVSAQVKAEVDALLQAAREVNFLVFVADPTYTTIDVSFAAKLTPGYDPVAVTASVVSALTAYLSPGRWGVPTSGDPGSSSGWQNANVVRWLEVTAQIDRVDGVDYVLPTTKIGVHGGSMGTVDIALSGVAPLTRPGTIAGTVT